jgi:RHS repeat-associated protein
MNIKIRFLILLILACCTVSVRASAPDNPYGYPAGFTDGRLAGGADGATYLDKVIEFLKSVFDSLGSGTVAGTEFLADGTKVTWWVDPKGGSPIAVYTKDGHIIAAPGMGPPAWLSGWSTTPSKNYVFAGLLELGSAVLDPVSVNSGAFIVSENDLSVSGPAPLTVDRTYSSIALALGGDIGGVWHFNHDASLSVSESVYDLQANANLPEDATVYVMEQGSQLGFGRTAAMVSNTLMINTGSALEKELAGINNYNGTGIGGGSSLHNYKMSYDPASRTFTEVNGAGRRRVFQRVAVALMGSTGTETKFLLQYEQLPNGTKTLYTYDPYGFRVQLRLTDSSQTTVYNWIKFEYDHAYRIKALVAKDGRRVEYIYDEFGDLVKVIRPDNTAVSYEYEQFHSPDGYVSFSSHRLLRVDKPEGRSLVNEYYRAGDVVNGQALATNDFRLGRVKLQKAPVGGSVKPVANARFFYEKNTDGSGITDVYDILGNRTRYVYGTNDLLTSITKYTKTGSSSPEPLLGLDAFTYTPYSIERRFWDDKGNLLAKTVEGDEDTNADGMKDLLSCWTATYDASGNLLTETVWGNISGTCTSFPIVNASGVVTNASAVESVTTRYTYSSDGFNLRTSMTDPAGRVTRYVYNAKAQLTSSYTCKPDSTLTPFDNPVMARTFYEYDAQGVLLSTISDDGTSAEITNLGGVTERSRIETVPGTSWPVCGQPQTITKQYWASSGWQTLTRTDIGYNTQGWPVKETMYDANATQLATTSRTYDFMGKVLTSTDADGHTTCNTYDFNGNLVTQDGPRTDIRDTKTVRYDFFDRPVSESIDVREGTVLTSATAYDGFGNKTSQTDHFGSITRFYYDSLHRLTNTVMPSVSGPDSTVLTPQTAQRYDVLDRVVETIDARDGVTATDYTTFGKPAMITYPDQTVKRFEYNPDGSLSKEIASTGNYMWYWYDSMGRTTNISSYTVSGKLISSVESTYDSLHLCSTRQANGDEVRYYYDSAGRQSRVEGPESKQEFIYDSLGRVKEQRTWYNGTDWTCTKSGYSSGGKTLWTSVEKSDGTKQRVVGYAYDEAGNRVVERQGALVSDAGSSGLSYFSYNALNQMVSSRNAEGDTSSVLYDFSGTSLEITTTDPLTNKTIMVADALGRTRTVLKKNASGQLLHQTDYIYNAAGDILEQTDYVQSAPGTLKHATTLKWTYDEASHSGRRVSFTRAAESTSEQRTETYHYDNLGRLFYTAYPGGLQIFNYYDDAQRLKYLFSNDGTVRYQYTYDSAGRLDTVMDEINNVKVDRTYGIENRLLDETVTIDSKEIQTGYAYDRSGRPTRLRLDNNTAVDYAYDGVNLSAVKRMSGVTAISSQGVVNYQHVYTARDAMGRIVSSTLADGSTQTITRDILGRSTSITTPWWNWAVDSQNGYDPAGNLHNYTAVDPVGTLSYTNGYDSLYHLTNHHSSVANQKFSYDSIGNRLTGPSVFASAAFNYTYNLRNELQSRTDPNGTLGGTITVPVRGLAKPNPYTAKAITAVTVKLDTNPEVAAQLTGEDWEVAGGGVAVPVDGNNHTLLINATDADGKISARTLTLNYNAEASSSYVYDLRGNLVQKTVHTNPLQITSYTYDALNRLTSVESNAQGQKSKASYRYDYLNRRISKTVTTGTGGSSSTSTEYYLWSGMNQIGIMDGNLNLLKFRMLGEGMGAEVGSAVAVEIGQTNYIPVHDQRGNVVAMVNRSTSAVAESYRYDAYGNVKIYDSNQSEIANHQSAIGNPWLFSSKQLDEETGLYYFTRRYYDPTLGRFVTTDPLGAADGINMYGYVRANPMMFVDPSGLLAKKVAGFGINIGTSPIQLGVHVLSWTGVMSISTPSAKIQQLCQQYGLTYEQYMQLETDSYSDKDNGLGFATRMKTYHEQSGYDAVQYQLANGKYILFNRGTEVSLLSNPVGSLKDWVTNIGQGLGFEMQQYQDAANLGRQLSKEYGNNIAFAGHSLGGGLTAMQVSVTGLSGLTLNPAGLNLGVMKGLGGNSANLNNLNNIINPGEILNTLQYVLPGMPNAVGNQYYVMPSVFDGIFSVNPLGLHSGINKLP